MQTTSKSRWILWLGLLILLCASPASVASGKFDDLQAEEPERGKLTSYPAEMVWLPAASQPYPGPDPHLIPGRIEAEDYDTGGQGVAYYDTTAGNEGGQYRDDDVDIEDTADVGGGYNVGWIEAGEWLAYSVFITSTGDYDIQLRLASAMYETVNEISAAAGPISWTVPLTRTLHVEIDGQDVTGPMTFVATGGWQNWIPIFARRIPLTAGEHVMYIVMDSGGMNVNWVWFLKSRPADESPEETIEWLIAQMTLEEKIAQLHGIDWMDTADNFRLGIPGFRFADGPHGIRGGPSTSFPVGIAMAATWDPALLERVGAAMGEEFRGRGRNQALGPCLDVNRDPRNGRGPESAGEDPYLAGQAGVALVRGIQSTQAIATAKHFTANNHQAGRREADHKIDARTLREFYGYPFRLAVQRGDVWSVMNAYNWINHQPSSQNRELLTTVLRDEWGYDYYVISDWGAIYGSAAEAINAGTDLEMPHVSGRYISLPDPIANGQVTLDTLDEAVRRVLRAKMAAGLLGDYPPGDPADVCSQAHRGLALEVAQKGIVLLKNEDNILPLNKDQITSIALIGPSAKVAQLDGQGSSVVEPCYAVTPWQGISRLAPDITINYARGSDINSDDRSGFPEAIAAAEESDLVIFVGGLDNTQEGEERDRVSESVQLPGQQQPLINELAAVNPNIVVVIESGGIVALEGAIPNIKGLLYAFYPGIEGGNAIADILFGAANPSGKLPVTMPRNDDQLPAGDDLDFSLDLVDGFGYRRFDSLGASPQYAFGFGLSYTTFDYGRLVVTPTVDAGRPAILVSASVTNSGETAGDEIVQLYLSADFTDPQANAVVPMPVKQLRGFKRVSLEPGFTETVTFTLGLDELSFWSISDSSFRVEGGVYTVRVGGSSDDLPLSGTFELDSSLLYDSAADKVSPADLPVLPNIALNRSATCSSIENDDPLYACGHAVDGDLVTRWSSQFSDPQWITVDLGLPVLIRRVILHWETAYGKSYRIQASTGGVHWRDVYSTTMGDGQVDNLDLFFKARYVRLYVDQRGTGWGDSLWELQIYGVLSRAFLPIVNGSGSVSAIKPELRVIVDDFVPQPFPWDTEYHFNQLGGERGALNDSILDLGPGLITATITSGQSWGGLWTGLNHPIGEKLPVDFSAALPAQIRPAYQSQITGISVKVVTGTVGITFRLELRDRDSQLQWGEETTLTGGPQTVRAGLPPLGEIKELLWIMDDAQAGDSVVVDSVSLTITTQITDTATAAFVWSYGMLLNNMDAATALVRDKGRQASGEFDAIQATGSLAAATALAAQLGIVNVDDARQIVTTISDTLLLDLPRHESGLWPHFVISQTGAITIAPGTEWSSVDTVIAAIGLLDGQNGLGLDTSGTEAMIESIDWHALVRPGGISHGFWYNDDPIPSAWDVFGGETWLLELAHASASGQVTALAFPLPPTANGSGFIDELAWLYVLPPTEPDYWGNDWEEYRKGASLIQLDYYETNQPGGCFDQLGLFGLSAGEVPIPWVVPPGQSIYQAFGVGGQFWGPNDGAWLLGAPLVMPHYSAMIASLRPVEALTMWTWLINEGPFSPLNSVESFLFPADALCEPGAIQWNQLKGSWNLALQTLGWGNYLLLEDGQMPVTWQTTHPNVFLKRGYDLLVGNKIVVTSTNDSGAGSLRLAIASAESGARITFADYLAGQTIHLSSTLQITKDLMIKGPAEAKIHISGGRDDSDGRGVLVLKVGNDSRVTLSHLAIEKGGGFGPEAGGIMLASGVLTVTNCTISDNTGYRGGGIYSQGKLTVTDSVIVGNDAFGGGGVWIEEDSVARVERSLIADNTSNRTGGGMENRGTSQIDSSTFLSNDSGEAGGAAANSGNMTIKNSTFTNNVSVHGGGIYNFDHLLIDNSTFSGNLSWPAHASGIQNYSPSQFVMRNTIVVNGRADIDCQYGDDTFPVGTNNWIEDGSCQADYSGDPQLEPLADNGGPTPTHALSSLSPAIDLGDNETCLAIDQRGISRPLDGNGDGKARCDIGAYEYEGPADRIYFPLLLTTSSTPGTDK